MNSAKESSKEKKTQWRLQNRPLYKGKVDLVLKIISFVCCRRKEGDSLPYFQSQFLRVYNHREMVEIKSLIKELEIDFNRARKGKPPLNNAEGKPKKNISLEVLQKYIQ